MRIKKWRKIISLFVLSFVITTSLPVEIFAESVADRISESSKDANETQESEDQNKNSNQGNDKQSVTDADNKDFIGPIKTGESQNANDGPNVEVREVPEDMKQFFIGEKDLHSLGSYLEQEELAKQSDEWDALKAEKFSRSTGYRLSENGRLTANVARYTPTGLWYDHDIIIRWQLDGEDVFCIEEGVFTQAGINYEHRTDLSSIVGTKAMRLSMIGYFGYYTQRSMQNYALTQMMIWDEMGGSFINYGTFGRSTYETHRDAINQKISEHNLNPSWHNTKITLKVGEEVRISDTHNRFSSWAGNVLVGSVAKF